MNSAERDYDPRFLDSVLKSGASADSAFREIGQAGAEVIPEVKVWDVQSINPQSYVPMIFPVILFLLVILVLLKFFSKNFFEASFQSVFNDKVFLLNHRSNRFTEHFPWYALFLIRVLIVTIIVQYGAYFVSGDSQLVSAKYFLLWLALVGVFFSAKFFLEWLVHALSGNSKEFAVAYMQHLLITSWLWIPLLALPLIWFLHFEEVNWKIYIVVVVVFSTLTGLFAMLRSLMLWGNVARTYIIYFFIYFCTFKILPYALVMKWVSNHWEIFTK